MGRNHLAQLENGDLITVDATVKTIYRGRVEYLLTAMEKKQGLMEARIEGHDSEFMKKSIEILGYLSLHTRQIDMITSVKVISKNH